MGIINASTHLQQPMQAVGRDYQYIHENKLRSSEVGTLLHDQKEKFAKFEPHSNQQSVQEYLKIVGIYWVGAKDSVCGISVLGGSVLVMPSTSYPQRIRRRTNVDLASSDLGIISCRRSETFALAGFQTTE
jgi:hypothetical protein